MSNTVYLKSMPFGSPGVRSRPHEQTCEPQLVSKTAPPLLYGAPVKMVAGFATAIAAADTAAVIYGFLVRPWPAQDTTWGPTTAFGLATPPTFGSCDILKRGYMLVQVGAGVAAPQGVVYMRVATPATGKPIGGIEAVADGANTVVVANAIFMTAADENGVAEIAYNL